MNKNCVECGEKIGLLRRGESHCTACVKNKSDERNKANAERARIASKNAFDREQVVRTKKAADEKRREGIILSTEASSNLPITDRLGLVFSEIVEGTSAFKDLAAGITNVTGGRSGAIENTLSSSRAQALNNIREQAFRLNADAVVGITVSYADIGATGSTMIMVNVAGTAVKLASE